VKNVGDILGRTKDEYIALRLELDSALRDIKDLKSVNAFKTEMPFDSNTTDSNATDSNAVDLAIESGCEAAAVAAIAVSVRPQASQKPKALQRSQTSLKNTGLKAKAIPKGVVIGAEVAFYVMLVLFLVFALLLASTRDNKPVSVLGFSAVSKLTGSMQSQIPYGSLVVARRVAAERLEVGDDISFFMGPEFVVTHRIIEIYESFLDTNERGFVTKGTDNALPDREVVRQANVIGRVVFHSEGLGVMLAFFRHNIVLSVVLGVLVIGSFTALRNFLSNAGKKEEVTGFGRD
jgi:signal peptidase